MILAPMVVPINQKYRYIAQNQIELQILIELLRWFTFIVILLTFIGNTWIPAKTNPERRNQESTPCINLSTNQQVSQVKKKFCRMRIIRTKISWNCNFGSCDIQVQQKPNTGWILNVSHWHNGTNNCHPLAPTIIEMHCSLVGQICSIPILEYKKPLPLAEWGQMQEKETNYYSTKQTCKLPKRG